MAWQLMIHEGLSMSAMARLGEFALALAGVPQTVRIVCGPPEGWLRLFAPAEQALLKGMVGPPEERSRVLWCGSGTTAPRFPAEATWCVLAEGGAALPDAVADRYERVVTLVDGAAGKPQTTHLPGCADSPVLGNTPARLLVILCGRAHQDDVFLSALREAGPGAVEVFDPYAREPCHPAARRTVYARCGAAVSVDPVGDDYFLMEAAAHRLSILQNEEPAALQRALRTGDAAMRPTTPAPSVMPWPQVAQQVLALAHRLATPSPAQIQRLLLKMQHATHLPTVLLKTPTRPSDEARAGAQVGFSVASDSICTGLSHQTEARFNLRWLLNTPDEVSRRRLYHYPYQRNVGIFGDEMDFAHLPAALAHHQVDMLCTTQTYTHGLHAARTAWATRATPVVGMLHSLHASALASEMILQMLDGPSLPCDAWISPTACGVEAHQRLLEAAGAHLAQNGTHTQAFAGSWHVIPYGIDRGPFTALHPRACRQALGLSDGMPIALSLGRFLRHEKADLMPLLLAWEGVLRVHPQALLLLAGSHDRGQYARNIRALCAERGIGERVMFFENVSPCDKHLLYGAADFFVTVSDNLQETYGLTVVEAMAAGLPVVAAGWDGYRETVRHGETGFLVPVQMVRTRDDEALLQRIAEGIMGAGHRDVHETVVLDVQALARHMRTLIDSPALRQRMGAAAARVCAAEYDQDVQAERMRNLFADLLRQARTVPWSTPRPQPFRDRITERFAHFASHGYLQESQVVAVARNGADATARRRILQQAGWATPECLRFADTLCDHIAHTGGQVTIGAALDTLAGDRYRNLLQVARLLKYAIVRLA